MKVSAKITVIRPSRDADDSYDDGVERTLTVVGTVDDLGDEWLSAVDVAIDEDGQLEHLVGGDRNKAETALCEEAERLTKITTATGA